MKNAILVHGWAHKDEFYSLEYPTSSNSHWFPWLSKQLMIRDTHAVALEMPKSYYPEYPVWKKELERFEVDENTTLVGHSCGGGFLVRWLSENKDKKLGKVVLVAPWIGINPDQPFDESFFDFVIDSKLAERTSGLIIFNSSNDVPEIHESIRVIKDNVENINIIELKDKGHFTLKSLGTEEFPELLEEILR